MTGSARALNVQIEITPDQQQQSAEDIMAEQAAILAMIEPGTGVSDEK